MNACTKLALIFMLTVGLAMPSVSISADTPEPTSLAGFSTEEIVAEYQQRLTHIIDVRLHQISRRLSDIKAELKAEHEISKETGVTTDSRNRQLGSQAFEEYATTAQDLTHFARIGDLRAEEIIGPTAFKNAFGYSIEKGFRKDDKIACEGIVHTFSAARKGSATAIETMPFIYMLLRASLLHKTDPSSIVLKEKYARKTAYWLLEKDRLTGSPNSSVSGQFLEFSAKETEQLRKDWISWSPARASIYDVMQILCPSWINDNSDLTSP